MRHVFRAYLPENYIFKEHHGTPLRAFPTMPHDIFDVLLVFKFDSELRLTVSSD
jgi:hypothetical protein